MTVNVLVELSNRNIDKYFTYNVPENLENRIKIGIRVKVPFGRQKLEGFIMEINNSNNVDLKDIYEIVDDEIILNDELLKLGHFIKEKTLCTLISAYQTMLPKALKAQNKTNISKAYTKLIELNINKEEIENLKLNEKQEKIINEVIQGNNNIKVLKEISISSLKTLLDKKILKERLIENYRLDGKEIIEQQKHELNNEQKKAYETILNGSESVYLLHGVTGSGKTEVYMELIEKMLDEDKTAIVLVPEISLTPQMVLRFRSRFHNTIAILHSRLSEGEKYDEYRKISKGLVKIVIGARSAVFAPLKNIGIIIIDEEHTPTYKQESNPKYSAIDVAIERAKINNAKLVLGSATPSLESYSRTLAKKYVLVELKERANKKPLPEIELIDMNKEKKGTYFSKRLIEKINEKLEKKEQIILLLNRRGYASFITCSSCGYVSKCPNCDVTLTYHKSSDMERCHLCGYATKRHITCPVCHEESVKNLGVGTEKIEEELNKMFNARIIRMDFDTTSTKGAHEKIITSFKNHEYDILLGTQMIAKGLDFPLVTLVGVINADTSLMIPNFRSSEYTFELLSQVAGRSGRSDKEGFVIIQSFNVDHYAIKLSKTQDYKLFFKQEMNIRRKLNYPPYCYLVYVKVIGTDYELVRNESNIIRDRLKENLKSKEILGPSIGSTFKIKNTYRFGITIKYKKEDNLYPYLNSLLEYYKTNNKITIDIDFNPVS
ncbi:MAG: primosomal protein N' [Bacilli bacterium]|nr:primosomal protein N' [Bacilli bacterium]